MSTSSHPHRAVTDKHYRGASNSNTRGSAESRRRRKRWLLDTFGDGEKAPCYRCAVLLTFDTLTVDKIKPQVEGGTYRRENIRPACHDCNAVTGGALTGTTKRKATTDEARDGAG